MGIDAEMLMRVRRPVDAVEVHRHAVELAIAFGADRFMIDRDSRYGKRRHCLEIVDTYEQDGPEIAPDAGETFVRVRLWTRFYGPGYERGDLVFILAVARVLRVAFAPCEVWYGGDSSGVLARHLDDEYERELWEHFCSQHGRAYFTGRNFRGDAAPRCDFCEIDMSNFGGGGDVDFWYCNGCGTSIDRSRRTGAVTPHVDWREGIKIPNVELDGILHQCVAAMSLDETRVVAAGWDKPGREGNKLRVEIETSWQRLSPDERQQGYERALESFGAAAARELGRKAP